MLHVNTMKNVVSSIVSLNEWEAVKTKVLERIGGRPAVQFLMHFSMFIPKLTSSLLPSKCGHGCKPMDLRLANN